MLRTLIITTFLLSTFGCQIPEKQITHEEYKETYTWDEKKGSVKNWEASYKVSWKN